MNKDKSENKQEDFDIEDDIEEYDVEEDLDYE